MDLERIEFHDATLIKMTMEWHSGVVTLELRTPNIGPLRVVVEDARGVHVSRKMEWGRSDSVMGCDFSQGPKLSRVVVRMQSGDVVEIQGRAVVGRIGLGSP